VFNKKAFQAIPERLLRKEEVRLVLTAIIYLTPFSDRLITAQIIAHQSV
jgi:hypothetical protein